MVSKYRQRRDRERRNLRNTSNKREPLVVHVYFENGGWTNNEQKPELRCTICGLTLVLASNFVSVNIFTIKGEWARVLTRPPMVNKHRTFPSSVIYFRLTVM